MSGILAFCGSNSQLSCWQLRLGLHSPPEYPATIATWPKAEPWGRCGVCLVPALHHLQVTQTICRSATDLPWGSLPDTWVFELWLLELQ